MSTPATTPAANGGGKLKYVIVAILGLAAGITVPMVMGGNKDEATKEKKSKKESHDKKNLHTINFSDVVVNLAEERMTRYLRLKIVLTMTADSEEKATEHVAKHKAAMKNWLIGHLAGKSLKEVSGTVGVKRLQREILERFEEMLELEEPHHLVDVLFEEYVVQ